MRTNIVASPVWHINCNNSRACKQNKCVKYLWSDKKQKKNYGRWIVFQFRGDPKYGQTTQL